MNTGRKGQLAALCLVALLSAGCSRETGNLLFTANGEEFIVLGLVSKEGWKIEFDRALVNLRSPEAYNSTSEELSALLKGDYLIDLKKGTADSPPVAVGIVPRAGAGNYQSLKFSLAGAEQGEMRGYSLLLQGRASKNSTVIPFLIRLEEELTFDGREGYVGDSVKGILGRGETTEVEMTFHFDHIFGNMEAGAEDHVNSNSPGFQIFLDYADDKGINVSQREMKDHELYNKLIGGIETLGHLGEGHCDVTR